MYRNFSGVIIINYIYFNIRYIWKVDYNSHYSLKNAYLLIQFFGHIIKQVFIYFST